MGHATFSELEAGLDHVRQSPASDGTIELIVRRPAEDEREIVTEATLDPVEGLVGDTWHQRGSSHTPDGAADPERQLTLMNIRAATLFARRDDRRPLAGDQLFVDLDLSTDNLPAGTRLAIGTATVEITEPPHTGCSKFSARFGPEALRFVNAPTGRALRLRGVNAKVVVGGIVRVGDPARPVAR